MIKFRKFTLLFLSTFLLSLSLHAVTQTVNLATDNTTPAQGTLRYAIINSSSGDTIDCSSIAGQTITLAAPLPAITKSYTIINNGASPVTISGTGSHFQGFSIASGTSTIQNFILSETGSAGGAGGAGFGGGGGGVGGGGGLYVHNGANVTISAVQFISNQAVGGAGGAGNGMTGGGGGGGGYGGGAGGTNNGGGGGGNSSGGAGGNAGVAGTNGSLYGGGGGGGSSSSGGTSGGAPLPTPAFAVGSPSGANGGGGAGAGGAGGTASATTGGTGGAGLGTDTSFGGGGGGGAGIASSAGGAGTGTGGGGGAANGGTAAGGAGGSSGGGGGGSAQVGGAGGYGSGGGGGGTTAGVSSFGGGSGGTGATPGGGGGAALGGAIFVQNGGVLTIGDGLGLTTPTTNTVTGGTGANGGGNGQALSPDLFIRSGGSVIFNLNANSLTIATAINSDEGVAGSPTTGGIALIGTKTLTLSGVNTYSGGTNIQGGIFNVPLDTALGTTAVGTTNGVMIGNATFQAGGSFTSSRIFNLSAAATIDTQNFALGLNGIIGGTGSLTKVGAGTLTLSGANTYSGGTTINAGVLSINADTALGASTGNLTIGAATLQTSAAITSTRSIFLTGAAILDTGGFADTLSGSITGTGSLTVATAGGNLTLSGANSYSGGTTINSMVTVQGDSTSLQGNIQDNGILLFNQTSNGTYAGALSGAGQFTQQGTGTLQLTGTSPFSGATTVSSGGLQVDGSLSSSAMTIAMGAILSGVGTVGAVTNSGQIAPGDSTSGTLTVNGNLTLMASSQVNIAIAPTVSSVLSVTGTAALNGALSIVPTSGFFGLEQNYTILTSSGLGGSLFSSFSTTDPNFTPTLSYTATNVLLNIQVSNPFLGFSFANSNEMSVGNNIGALNGANLVSADLLNVVDSFAGQSTAVINDALDQMHPGQFGAFADLQAEVGGQLVSLFHRKPYLPCNCYGVGRIWAEPFGDALNEKSEGQFAGFHSNTEGIAGGIDGEVLDNWILGIGGAWDTTQLEWHRSRGHATINGWYGAFYTDYQIDNFYFGASVLAGMDHYEATREIQFITTNRKAHSDYNALDVVAQFTTAYFFGSPVCHIYPYATIDYFYLDIGEFTETGASGLDLNVKQRNNSTLRTEAGLALQVQDKNGDETICISPLISLGWVMIHPLDRNPITATFSGEPIPFNVVGWDRTWQLITANFGMSFYYKCFSFGLQYNVLSSTDPDDGFFDQNGSFHFEWKW